MDLTGNLQAFCVVNVQHSIQTSGQRVLAVRRESHRSYHVGYNRYKSHALVRNTPQSELGVERASEEKAIITRMELNGSDKITMLEAT